MYGAFGVPNIKTLHLLCCPSLFSPPSLCSPQLQSRSCQIRMGAVQLSPKNTSVLTFQLSAAVLEVICCYRLNTTEQKQSNVHILCFSFFSSLLNYAVRVLDSSLITLSLLSSCLYYLKYGRIRSICVSFSSQPVCRCNFLLFVGWFYFKTLKHESI